MSTGMSDPLEEEDEEAFLGLYRGVEKRLRLETLQVHLRDGIKSPEWFLTYLQTPRTEQVSNIMQ